MSLIKYVSRFTAVAQHLGKRVLDRIHCDFLQTLLRALRARSRSISRARPAGDVPFHDLARYVEFPKNGGVIVYGRSDATLNPGGVRIGSAEIYSALDHFSEISGSVVVGWTPPRELDEVIILFVVPQVGKTLNDELKKRIRQIIREKESPRHVPKHIFQISEVPITRSGKTVELSVKAVLAGKTVKNRNALANPEILQEFEKIRKTLSGFYSA